MRRSPESLEGQQAPPDVTMRRRVVDRFRGLYGDQLYSYFESDENNRFFEELSKKIDEQQPLYGLPEGIGGQSMDERLWALAQVKAILPENNLVAQGDTHNKSLENYIKLALIVGDDPLTLMVFLSMLSVKSEDNQDSRYFAQQQMYIWAPLAGVLGLNKVRTDFEDDALRVLEPESYQAICTELENLFGPDRDGAKLAGEAEGLAMFIESELDDPYLSVTVQTRPKSVYAIWQKRASGKEKITDYLGIRVIIDHVEGEGAAVDACYAVKRIIDELYSSGSALVGRSKDYITYPKPNGYQSIHVTVQLPESNFRESVAVEIQVRTKEMHRRVEQDVYLYQQYVAQRPGIGRRSSAHVKKKTHSIYEWRTNFANTLGESGSYTQEDIMGKDCLFMFNKDANLFLARRGETVLDGAFYIHSNHASRTTAVYLLRDKQKVLVPYDHTLQDGDCVELAYNDKDRPTWRDGWSSLTRSDVAHEWLRKAAKKRDAESYILLGLQKIAREMERHHWGRKTVDLLSDEQKEELVRKSGLVDFNAYLLEIGAGTQGPGRVARMLSEVPLADKVQNIEKGTVIVVGLEDCGLTTRFAGCCDGEHADELVANWSPRLSALNIHDRACASIQSRMRETPELMFTATRA